MTFQSYWLCVLLTLLSSTLSAAEGNRLAHLDMPCNPYYVDLDFPKLTTPQWVGEEGVETVVVLAIDDMRDPAIYERYLRPILERLKQIDGRAPVSIMTNSVDPQDPQLQAWLEEGLSIEVHTIDHPCPLLADGDLARSKSTYDRCVDLLGEIPNNQPVAFRMPCCDSLNTPSPRFFTEIFNRRTDAGNYLAIDSSVFHLFTAQDKDLPLHLVRDTNGRDRFRKYIPFPAFVNWIENYPYPYVVAQQCWQFPCVIPSDWEGQNLQQPNNPRTLEDLKAALDATVIKQGVYNLVFHPHGWIRSEQIIDLIDHAVQKHGSKIKFLNFREAITRINHNLLDNQPLRSSGDKNEQAQLFDINGDGFLDVMTADGDKQVSTRIWVPAENTWRVSKQSFEFHKPRFGFTAENNMPSFLEIEASGTFVLRTYEDSKWKRHPMRFQLPATHAAWSARLELAESLSGYFFRDLNNDGQSEFFVEADQQSLIFSQHDDRVWEPLPFTLPPGAVRFTSEGGDAGLRFVDVDQDGFDDCLFSNGEQYSLHLFHNMQVGWSTEVISKVRRQTTDSEDRLTLPPIVRPDGSNNGAWFHSGQLWLQNEDTNRLPDLVERQSFRNMLAQSSTLGVKETPQPAPLSPEKSLATIQTHPDLKVDLVAAEPLVADPIAFDWGTDGRLWVVEMHDYPNGLTWNHPNDRRGEAGGRIKILTDTDGDGRYDKASLFLDKIPFPTGIKVWRKGVLISAAPEVFYAEDSDGDGQADQRQTLYQGFGEGNQQHRMNGLRWGLDNWLHLANGDSGGTIRSLQTEETVEIGGRDLRIRPDNGTLEALSGQTQFGRNRDDWGNWFGGNNSNPMWHYVLEDRYLRRNPFVVPPNLRQTVSVQPNAATVFPTSITQTRFNDPNGLNRFTSACSPTIYRDEFLGEMFAGNAFVCEPVHNLVHREIVSPAGISFTSRRAEEEQQSEFLSSTDNWFRPTMIRTGPDGALWIADIYRFVIEHPEWIPPDLQNILDMRAGSNRGRIYRVYRADLQPPKLPQLDKLSPKQLVQLLESPNGWLRDMAQQILIWRGEESVTDELALVVKTGKRATARLHALCTLDGLNTVDPALVTLAVKDVHAGVRKHAIRIAARFPENEALTLAVLEAASKSVESEPVVLLQALLTFGHWKSHQHVQGKIGRFLAATLEHYRQHPYLRSAALSSLNQANVEHVLLSLLERKHDSNTAAFPLLNTPQASLQALEQVVTAAVALKGPTSVAPVFERIVTSDDPNSRSHAMNTATTLVRALRAGNIPIENVINESLRERISALHDHAIHVALDASATLSDRLQTLRFLSCGLTTATDDLTVFTPLLSPREVPEIQGLAASTIVTLGGTNYAHTAKQLLRNWPTYSPVLRGTILDLFLSRPGLTRELLQALKTSTISALPIDARRQTLLLQHEDQVVRQGAEELFRNMIHPNRQKVLEEYQEATQITGVPKRGQATFTKRCSNCHRVAGMGHAVGPDLSAIKDRSSHALLIAILDPNRAVENKFLDYVAVTEDGRQVTGMLARETSNSISLQGPEGKEQTLLREEIEELRTSGKSLMPEGMEKDLRSQDIADLIAYLQELGTPPKSFPGNEPKVIRAGTDGVLELSAADCRIYGPRLVFEQHYKNLGYWSDPTDHAIWTLVVPQSGTYRVIFDYASDNSAAGDHFTLSVGEEKLLDTVIGTGSWDDYTQKEIGEIQLPAGTVELLMQSAGVIKSAMIDLRTIYLEPIP